jgi:hypothetical protein
MRMKSRCPAGVLVRAWLLSIAIVGTAAADPAFVWRAPPDCPGAGDVRSRIEHRLGRSLDEVAAAITVVVAAVPAGYVARVDPRAVTVDNDVRTLTSRRCDELADAVAVIVARLASRAARVGLAVGEAPDRRPIVSEHAIEPVPATQTYGGGVRVLGLSGIGRIPSVGLGAEVAAFVRRHDKLAEIAFARWNDSTLHLHTGAPAGVGIGLDVITLRLGWSPAHLPIRSWVAGELGQLRAAGVALVDPQTGTARWSAVGAGFEVAWPMFPTVRLVGTFELAVPLERAGIQLNDRVELYRPSWLTAHTALGLELGPR